MTERLTILLGKQIMHQLRTQCIEGNSSLTQHNSVTLKSRLRVTSLKVTEKQNQWVDHAPLTISRII